MFRKELLGETYFVDDLISLIWGLAIIEYCVIESKSNNKPIDYHLRFYMLMVWPIAVPIYIVWTERIDGILTIILYFLLIFMAGVVGLGMRAMLGGEIPFLK
jgi:predicted membrane channel-forming protein YqfA (hemolysin III family)